MNNKGFTLIELIVTILLLSIIAVISFVSINGVINKNKKNNCITIIDNIKSATSEYVSDNRYKTAFTNNVIDNKISITANTLVTSNYLTSPIINPVTNSEINANNIIINIVLNDDYTVNKVSVDGINCE